MEKNIKNAIFGYARVSTEDQNLDAQIDALKRYGCDEIFTEKVSGAKMQRTQLNRLFTIAVPGDTVVVTKLDRLGRTIIGLREVIDYMKGKNIEFVSLTDNIETATASGKFMFHIMAAMAEWERDIISERTKEGIRARQARGIKMGQLPKIEGYPKRIQKFQELYDSGDIAGMTDREVWKAIEAADKKAPRIKSFTTYQNWQKAGFPGAVIFEDEPLNVKPRGRPRKKPIEE